MTDSDLLLQIQELLDGVEWTPDTLENIAWLMNEHGYRIRDRDDRDRESDDDETESDGDRFLNHYEHCGECWEDTADSMCNDRCPVCNAEIEPYESEDL
jgi:hypothetical protein